MLLLAGKLRSPMHMEAEGSCPWVCEDGGWTEEIKMSLAQEWATMAGTMDIGIVGAAWTSKDVKALRADERTYLRV